MDGAGQGHDQPSITPLLSGGVAGVAAQGSQWIPAFSLLSERQEQEKAGSQMLAARAGFQGHHVLWEWGYKKRHS